MTERNATFGLTLPNRGVLTGATTMDEMLSLARLTDQTPAWDSLWVGDSIFAKPRLDAISLLGALAVTTERVKLGPACFASTPLRPALQLAYQWASLDFMSNGRTIFVACQGQSGGSGGSFDQEYAALGIEPSTRMRRMEEAIDIMRLVTSQENASYEGEYNRFEELTVLPRAVQQPVPIWVTANPVEGKPKMAERALRRVARYGDGWMSTRNTPETFARNLGTIRTYAAEEERDLGPDFEACLYYNINVNEDRRAGFEESKRFLDTYYTQDFDREYLERWVAFGSPEECIQQLQAFIDAGATTITLRLTGFDQQRQFDRVTNEVLPAVASVASTA